MNSREVWKVSLPMDDQWHEYAMGRIVHVDCQHPALGDTVEVWFENEPPTTRRLRVFGTGHPIPDGAEHVGSTARMANGRLVWHVYEEVAF